MSPGRSSCSAVFVHDTLNSSSDISKIPDSSGPCESAPTYIFSKAPYFYISLRSYITPGPPSLQPSLHFLENIQQKQLIMSGLPTPPIDDQRSHSSRKMPKSSKSLSRSSKRTSSSTSHEHNAVVVDGRHKRVWKACERCRMKKTKVCTLHTLLHKIYNNFNS